MSWVSLSAEAKFASSGRRNCADATVLQYSPRRVEVSAMTDCERMILYLDGELPATEEAAAIAHLAGCASCQRDADDWVGLQTVLSRSRRAPVARPEQRPEQRPDPRARRRA